MQKTIMFCAVIAFLSIIFIGKFVLAVKLRESEDAELVLGVIILSLIMAVIFITVPIAM